MSRFNFIHLAYGSVCDYSKSKSNFDLHKVLTSKLSLTLTIITLWISLGDVANARADNPPGYKNIDTNITLHGKLSPSSSWLRQDPSDHRVRNGGLEIRTRPGNLWGGSNHARNVFIKPVPNPEMADVMIETKVTSKPTKRWEQANLAWYYDDSHMVKIGREIEHGKLNIVMGREYADRTQTIAIIPIKGDATWLRMEVLGNTLFGYYRTQKGGHWLPAGSCTLPIPMTKNTNITSKTAKIRSPQPYMSLHTYNGDNNLDHWVRYEEVKIYQSQFGPRKSIFNAKNFEGWEGNKQWFRIENNAIVAGRLKGNIPKNQFLCTTQKYTDFDLHLQVKLHEGQGNSGIQFRTQRIPNHHEVRGYQADVGLGWLGKIYDESRRNKVLASPNPKMLTKYLKPKGWNNYRIRCIGPRIQLWINGYMTVDYTEPDHKIARDGIIAVQIHSGPPSEVAFRNITIASPTNKNNHPPQSSNQIFNSQNLVAWCIVPFDAKKRTPEARAEMIKRLGLSRVAYDWRQQHIAEFEREIIAYKKHGIEYFAFWSWHPAMAPLIKKYGITPQIWQTCPSPKGKTQQERVQAAAKSLIPMLKIARKYNCKLGLYNHGGWGGKPQNLVAVCEYLKKHVSKDHVGIVYNLHHAHDQIANFSTQLKQMLPHLLCLNLNGMNDNAKPKILPIGQGKHDLKLLQIIRDSGYSGPIGILDHRSELDAEKSLKQNLDGLKKVKQSLK